MAKDMVQVRRGARKEYKGPDAKIGRSQFNRSCGLKTTFDASYLVPIFLDEVLPGDTMTMKLNGFARIFSPLDAPVMDNIELETFFFFCPTRLLWTEWPFFNGEHVSAGAQDTDYTIPVMDTGVTVDHDNVYTVHGLAAHLGLPHGLTTATVTGISSLPFRMYNFVFDEWFRDQNLKDGITQNRGTTADQPAAYAIQKSAKKHDYFTSALPYLQKGSATTVVITPSSGTEAVQHDAVDDTDISVYSTANVSYQKMGTDDIVSDFVQASDTASTVGQRLFVNIPTGLLDVNAMRQSVAIQRLLERDARGGTRYTEIIKAHFGVTSPDYRLQRPEYLGGGKSFINITPVANTSKTATEDQAELKGVGTGVISGHGWAKSFTEHGYIMGLVRARGDITYFEGLDRMWTRSTRYDFYIPALANIGEQSILNQEIFVSNSSSVDKTVWGYQERWAEYRMKQSRVVGNFNPDVTGALDHWHLAEEFGSLPALNQAFVEDATPMVRITTIDDEPDFLFDVWFDYKCARPLPVYSVPSLVERF